MKNVILRGPILTESGYGVHGRQFARWLLKRANIDVRFNLTPWGNTSWIINRDAYDGLAGQIMDRSVDGNHRCDVSFMLQLPNEWSPFAPVNVGITAGVETDICNPQWISCVESMTRVVVPSQHVKNTFLTTAQQNARKITKPVIVIPESYTDACALPIDKVPEPVKFSTDFNFLLLGQITGNNALNDRKNTFNAIRWLCDEFRNDQRVGIVIKTNSGTNSALDRQQTTLLMNKLVNEVRRGANPRIHLVHGSMDDADIVALYRNPQIKALVAPTRGEGFGLPILEAAACGLPIIATGWSGHLDYLSQGRFVKLDHALEPVHPSRIDGQLFVPGSRWAEVNESDFRARVRKFYGSPFVPQVWATELQKKLIESHSAKSIEQFFERELGDIL